MARLDLVLDCVDLATAEAFWTAALGYRRTDADGQYVALGPPEGETGPKLLLQRVEEPKTVKNRLHLDLSVDDVEAEVGRLLALGARRLTDTPIEELGHRWIVLADPEGNELCVCAS